MARLWPPRRRSGSARVKHDYRFPANTRLSLLSARGGYSGPGGLDAVAFYDKPLLKFERLLETYLAFAPRGLRVVPAGDAAVAAAEAVSCRARSTGACTTSTTGPIYFPAHHESHAASAFFPSPFDEAAIVTFDGVGEWTTTSWGIGKGSGRIELRSMRCAFRIRWAALQRLHLLHRVQGQLAANTRSWGWRRMASRSTSRPDPGQAGRPETGWILPPRSATTSTTAHWPDDDEPEVRGPVRRPVRSKPEAPLTSAATWTSPRPFSR
jgi:hypothetical protein